MRFACYKVRLPLGGFELCSLSRYALYRPRCDRKAYLLESLEGSRVFSPPVRDEVATWAAREATSVLLAFFFRKRPFGVSLLPACTARGMEQAERYHATASAAVCGACQRVHAARTRR